MRERTNDAATRSVWGSISFMGRTIAQMVRGGERATAQVAKLDRALRTASCRNPANDRPTRSFRPCDRTRQDRLRLRAGRETDGRGDVRRARPLAREEKGQRENYPTTTLHNR